LIKHPEGPIVVDTGQTARAAGKGYFPRWHPYYRGAVEFKVAPAEEIGPQLRQHGIDPWEVKTLILTHLHTDHSGGLSYFPRSTILVSRTEWRLAQGFAGLMRGYLPNRWPDWLNPEPISFRRSGPWPFPTYYPVTEQEDVVVVPTPGHTQGHVSVVVRPEDGLNFFLAGDTTYDQGRLMNRTVDGVSRHPEDAMATLERIVALTQSELTVYLPSHDPAAAHRLRAKVPLLVAA
jgi:glyoxylase-like metal-dependent hydrolase (beta-lactamase superfamily II)